MSIIRKREGDNGEILEVEEILKNKGFSISLAAEPEKLQFKEYIKRLYTSEFEQGSREELHQLLWLEGAWVMEINCPLYRYPSLHLGILREC